MNLCRDDWMVLIRAMLIASLLVLLMSSAALAQPCPPKRYFCWQVRLAAASFGLWAIEANARACGWSEAEIDRARKCLPKADAGS